MGIAISVLIAVAVTWVGIGCAFYSPYPIGFWVSSFAFSICWPPATERASSGPSGGATNGAPRLTPRWRHDDHRRARQRCGAAITGFANMLGQPFITHALVAGTAVALVCGLVGYFLVLRGQVFAGDAQGHIAYTGAMAALVAGLDPRVGLFAATIMAGVALGVISRRGANDVAIGSFLLDTRVGRAVFDLLHHPRQRQQRHSQR